MTRPPWEDDSDDLPSREDDLARRGPFIVIGYWRRKGIWRAIWIDNDRHDRFEGTRKEVIAWARERCDNIRITHSPDGDDYLYPRQLGPDDE